MASQFKRIKQWTARSLPVICAALTVLAGLPIAHAGPVGEQVESGSATFSRDGANTIIDVSTQNAIINYDSFNVAANELVRFNQLNAASRVLNRIDGAAPTFIDGSIAANGQVFFVNPAGVRFGPNSVFNVGGIYAAAGQISSADFLAGVNRFTGLSGEVINQGTINAQFVALVGKRVVNDGIIFSPNGLVTMVAGDEVLISEKDGSIMVKIDAATVKDQNADVAAVVNNGSIDAGENGQVVLAAGDMYWLAVKQDAAASTTANQIAVSAPGSAVQVSGSLAGAGTDSAIIIEADEIALYTAYVSGNSVNIGGSFQGTGPIHNAASTFVSADSTVAGDNIVVWSDNLTSFYGSIIAPGGFVEISGKQNLKLNPTAIDLAGGTLFLDPTNIIVDATSETGVTLTEVDGAGDADVDNGNGGGDATTNTIGADLIDPILAGGGTVTLAATNDITFSSAINGGAGAGILDVTAGNAIIVNATISLASGSILFDAGAGGISQTAAVTAAGVEFISAGAVTFTNASNNIDTIAANVSAGAFTFASAGTLATGTVGATTGVTASGAVDITAASPLNVNADVTGAGVTLTATDSAGAGDDLTIAATVTATGAANNIVLEAGDNLVFGAGAAFVTDNGTPGNVNAFIDFGDADVGTGGTADFSTNSPSFTDVALVNVTGAGDADTLTLIDSVVTIDGTFDGAGGLGDTLIGPSGSNNVFTINLDNAGDVDGYAFTNTEFLTGGAMNDTFAFGNNGAIQGQLDGGAGSDTLTGDDDGNSFSVTGANSGFLNPKIDSDSNNANPDFTNIENLVGGAGDDNFTFGTGSSILGTVDGGGGTDTLQSDILGVTFALTAAGGGTLAGIIDSDNDNVGSDFTGIDNLFGSAGDDTFTFTNAGSIAGTIDGSGGSDTLTGDDDGNAFVITGSNAGTLAAKIDSDNNNAAPDFTNIEILTGGSGSDTFNFLDAGSIDGTIAGGTGTDTLTGDDDGNAFVITGSDAGTLASKIDADNDNAAPDFTAIENLAGGAGVDTFTFENAGALTGTLDGAGGSDTLTGDEDGNTFAITGANSGTLSGKTTGWSNIEALTGGSGADTFTFANAGSITGALAGGTGTDTLTGDDDGNAFAITGSGSGTLAGKTSGWSAIENLAGGAGSDTFTFDDAGSIAGTLAGAAGSDTITGDEDGNTFTVNGAGNGTLATKIDSDNDNAGDDFTSFESLIGSNTVADTFTIDSLTAGQSLAVDGRGGDDIFNINTTTDDFSTILGTLTVTGGAGTGDSMTVSDTARGGNFTFTVGATSITDATSTVSFDATLETATLAAGNGNNTFNVTPGSTAFNINAGTGTMDTLDLNTTPLSTFPTLTPTTSESATFSFPTDGLANVAYTQIETLTMSGPFPAFLLVIDLATLGTTVDFSLLDANTIRIDGSLVDIDLPSAFLAAIDVLGTAGLDTVSITETAFGFPTYQTSAATGHTNTAYSAAVTGGLLPNFVGFHFDGNGGSGDNFTLTNVSVQDVSYFSDTADTAASGIIAVDNEFAMSFEGLTPLTLIGAGGTLTVDASANANVTTLDVENDSLLPLDLSDGENAVRGNHATFEDVVFSGYGSLVVLGGTGAQTINVNGPLDEFGGALTAITISGENTDNTDIAGADILNINDTPASMTITILGGGGNDTINIANPDATPAGNGMLDTIRGPVIVNGGGTNTTDTLNISDENASANRIGTITDTQITGLGMPNPAGITYSNIANLDLDTGTGNDTITINDSLFGTLMDLNTSDGDDVITVNDVGSTTTTNIATGADLDQVAILLNTFSAFNRTINVNAGSESDRLSVTGTTLASEEILLEINGGVDRVHLDAGGGNDQFVTYTGVERLDIDTSTGDDLVTIADNIGDGALGNTFTTLNINTTGGEVQEDGADPTITATNLNIIAADGIGRTNSLNTLVTNLAFRNTTSGAVQFANNVGALLNITDGNDTSLVFANFGNFGGGTTTITNASPVTVDQDYTFQGTTTLTATGTAGQSDDFTIDAATITMDGNALTLNINAGDDILFINAGDITSAGVGGHTVNLTADTEVAIDADRGSVSQTGTTTSVTAGTLNIIAAGNDGDHSIDAGSGIGDDGTFFRFNVDNLLTDTTVNDGNQFLREIDGLTRLTIDGDTATAFLQSGGDVTQVTTDSIDLDNLALVSTAAGVDFNLFDDDGATDTINDVENLAADITGSLVFVNQDGSGLLTLGTVTSGSQSVAGITIDGAPGSVDITADNIALLNTAATTDLAATGITLTTHTGGVNSDGVITITASSVADAGTGAFTMTADELVLNTADQIRGTGALTIQPDEATDAMSIGRNDAGDGTANDNADDLDLTDAEILALQNGFASITLGRSDGTHAITIEDATFVDPLQVRTPLGGSFLVIGQIIGNGNASIDLEGSPDGGTTINATATFDENASSLSGIVTAGNDITIGAHMIVAEAESTTFDPTNAGAQATGADVRIEGTIDGAGADTDGPAFAAGDEERFIVTAGTSGSLTTLDDIGTTADLILQFSGNQWILGNGITVDIGNTVESAFLFNDIQFNGATFAGTGVLQFAPLDLDGDISINSDLAGALAMDLRPGNGVAPTGPGTATVTTTDDVYFADGFALLLFGQTGGTGTIEIAELTSIDGLGGNGIFTDSVEFRMDGSGAAIRVGDSTTGRTLISSATDGTDEAGDPNDDAAIAAGFTAAGNGFTFTGSGSTTTLFVTNITTAGLSVIFNDAVILDVPDPDGGGVLLPLLTIDTTSGVDAGANIEFNGTLNGQVSVGNEPGEQDLTLQSGTAGDIEFNGAVGTTRRIGRVIIGTATSEDFRSVTALDSFVARTLTISQFADTGGEARFENGIDTSGFTSATIPASEAGGAITVDMDADNDLATTGDFIVIGTMDTSALLLAGAGAAGGAVTVEANVINIENIDSRGGESTGAAGGAGGAVDIDGIATDGFVTIDSILTTGGAGGGGDGGAGGVVDVLGDDVTIGTVTTNGGASNSGAMGGDAGTVTIDAVDGTPTITLIGSATPTEITAVGGAGAGGQGAGGNVTIGNNTTPGGGIIDTIRITVDDYGITTGDTAGNIIFNGFVDGDGTNDLTLTAGTQAVAAGQSDITFSNNVFDLDTLTVASAFDITFVESVGYNAVDAQDALVNIDLTATNDIDFGDGLTDFVLVTQQLRIRDANDVRFFADTNALPGATADLQAGSILQDTGDGTTSFDGTVQTQNAAGIDVANERIVFAEDVIANAAGDVFLRIDGDDSAQNQATGVAGQDQLVIGDGASFTLDGGGSFQQFGGDTATGDSTSTYTEVLLGGNITTQAGDIRFADDVELQGNTENPDANSNILRTGAAGGEIRFDTLVYGATDNTQVLILNSGNGNITVAGRNDDDNPANTQFAVGTADLAPGVDTVSNRTLADLIIEDANDTLFGGTVDSVNIIQQTGDGDTTFQGAVNVFEDATADLHTTAGDPSTAFVAAFEIDTAGTLRFDSSLTANETTVGVGGGNIVMNVGDVQFLGGANSISAMTAAGGVNVSEIVIQPFDSGSNIGVGSNAADMSIDSTDVNALAEGFENIFIGAYDGDGTITINDGVTFKDPTFFRAPLTGGTIEISGLGVVGSDEDDADGSLLVFDAPLIRLGGIVDTDGQSVLFVSGASFQRLQASNDNADLDTVVDNILADALGNNGTLVGADIVDALANAEVFASTIITTSGDAGGEVEAGHVYFENRIDGDGDADDLTVNAGGAAIGDPDGDFFVGVTDAIGTQATGQTGLVGAGDDGIWGNSDDEPLGQITVTRARNVTFGGSVASTGYEQKEAPAEGGGSGDTRFLGTSLFNGIATSLRTGAYDNTLESGDVDVVLDGPDGIDETGDEGIFLAEGAIIASGRVVALNGGAGQNGGFVSIEAGNIEVGRIDTSGSAANGTGIGGDAGSITLNATDADDTGAITDITSGLEAALGETNAGGTPIAEILLHGDLLARPGDGAGASDGNGADVTLGDATSLTDRIIIDPEVGQVTNSLIAADSQVVTIKGNDVDFNGPIDGRIGDGNDESLYVQTFNDAGQVPARGDTTFNAIVGGLDPLSTIRTDFDPTANTGDISNPAGDFPTTSTANGFTFINTTAITVIDELSFNDAVILDDGATAAVATITLTATDPSGTLRFNNTLNTDGEFSHNLTLIATTTIFDDEGLFGVGIQQTGATVSDGVDGIVGGTSPLGTLTTDDGAAADTIETTVLNTTALSAARFVFNDPVEVAVGTAATPNTGTVTINASNEEVDAAVEVPGADTDDAIVFNNFLNSFEGELNRLVLNTTSVGPNGGTTRFGDAATDFVGAGVDGIIGNAEDDRLAALTTNANGVTHFRTTTFLLNGTSMTINDPLVLFADVLVDEDNRDGIITFANTVNSDGTARDLTVTTFGGEGGAKPDPDNAALDVTTIFGGTVGGISALDVLTVNHDGLGAGGAIPSATDPGGDATRIDADISADTMNFFDFIQIGVTSVTLTGVDSAADGTTVTFFSMVDGQPGEDLLNSLTVNATNTTFQDDVGSMVPLNMLMTDATGTTTFGDGGPADTISVFANMIQLDDAVILAADTTITGHKPGDGTDTAALAIAFNSTVDSDAPGTPRDLTVITTDGGLTRFGDGVGTDNVGATNALDVFRSDINLTAKLALMMVNAPATPRILDTTLINSGTFRVVTEATFHDKVAIGSDVTIITTDTTGTFAGDNLGTVRFNNLLDGFTVDGAAANDLTINSAITIFGEDNSEGQGELDTTTAVDAIVGGAVTLDQVTIDGGIAGTTVLVDEARTIINTTAMSAQQFIFNDHIIVGTDLTGANNSGLNVGAGDLTITATLTDGDANPAFSNATDAISINAHLDSSTSEFNEIYLNTTPGVAVLGANRVTRIGNAAAAGHVVGTSATARPSRLVTDLDGQTHIGATTINTNGLSIEHNDPVILLIDTIYNEFGAGFIHFNSMVNSDLTARDLTAVTAGGLTRFGDNSGDDRVGAVRPLDVLITRDQTSMPGTDITEINADVFADTMQFDDAVRLGADVAPGDGTIRLGGAVTPTAATTITFNSTLNSVSDLLANADIDATTVNFSDGLNPAGAADPTADRIGTRQDDQVGTDGLINRLFVTRTGGTGTATFRTDVVLANQMEFDNNVNVDTATINFIGLNDASAPNDLATGGSDGVGDAIIFNGTLFSSAGTFADVNIDTVNGGDAWINGRVGTTDTATAPQTLAILTPMLGTNELGSLTTDNPNNPLVDGGSAHFLVGTPPLFPAADLAPNGTTHINTDVVKAGGAGSDDTEFFDPIVLDFGGSDIFISDFSGGIFFRNTLDSATDEENDLTLFAPGTNGVGDIAFLLQVGDSDADDDTTNTRLGDVSIFDARDVDAFDAFKAASVLQEGTTDGLVGDGTSGGSGNTVFHKNVDTSGVAGSTPEINSSLTMVNGGARPAPAAGDGGDIVIVTDGDVGFFFGANLDGAAGGSGGFFSAQPDFDIASTTGLDLTSVDMRQPENVLVLAGDFTSLGDGAGLDGLFRLSPLGRMGLVPSVATIRGAFSTLVPFAEPLTSMPMTTDVSITGGSIFIGADEKWTTYGDLTLIATDAAAGGQVGNADVNPDDAPIVHNDLAALGVITVTANDIRFRLRPASTVVPAFGNFLVSDLGLDIIAGDNIIYSVTPLALTGTAGLNPIFANPDADFDVLNTLAIYIGTVFNPVDEVQFRRQIPGAPLSATGIALDPSSFGPSNANISEALAALWVTPQQSGDILTQTIVGDFQRQLLADFAGVDLAELSTAQRLEFLTGRELYNDLPKGVDPVKVTVARALLTENRLLYDPVANMLTYYRSLFLEEVIDPTTGQPTLISRHIEHRRALASALDAYGQSGAAFDAQGFVNFLRSSEQHARAYRSLVGLRTLSQKFTVIGLTPRENGEAMTAVAERVTPEGITAVQLMQAVNLVEPDESAGFDAPVAPTTTEPTTEEVPVEP